MLPEAPGAPLVNHGRLLAGLLAISVLATARTARACDVYFTETFVGVSSDGKSALLRLDSDDETYSGLLIRVVSLPSGKVTETHWVLQPTEAGDQKLRAERWKNLAAELTGRGFQILGEYRR